MSSAKFYTTHFIIKFFFNFLTVISHAFPLISQNIPLRFNFLATTTVVPPPRKKSAIVSPSFYKKLSDNISSHNLHKDKKYKKTNL